LMFVGLLFNCY